MILSESYMIISESYMIILEYEQTPLFEINFRQANELEIVKFFLIQMHKQPKNIENQFLELLLSSKMDQR